MPFTPFWYHITLFAKFKYHFDVDKSTMTLHLQEMTNCVTFPFLLKHIAYLRFLGVRNLIAVGDLYFLTIISFVPFLFHYSCVHAIYTEYTVTPITKLAQGTVRLPAPMSVWALGSHLFPCRMWFPGRWRPPEGTSAVFLSPPDRGRASGRNLAGRGQTFLLSYLQLPVSVWRKIRTFIVAKLCFDFSSFINWLLELISIHVIIGRVRIFVLLHSVSMTIFSLWNAYLL